MKKLFLILALAIGLGAASPQKASAQEIVVTTIIHFDGYDYVEFNDGSFGLFFADGTYVIYKRMEGNM